MLLAVASTSQFVRGPVTHERLVRSIREMDYAEVNRILSYNNCEKLLKAVIVNSIWCALVDNLVPLGTMGAWGV